MRLKYNILWFENDIDWIDSIKEKIEDFLFENAFILNPDIQENANNLDQLITDMNNHLKDVDLILMDFNLLNSDKGDTIIQKIRTNEIFTEILFYSQDEKVREKFKTDCVEGIYFSDRDSFFIRLKQVIPHTIKKVLDLTNMRGLVMSETSLIDLKLNELLLAMIYFLDTKDLCLRQDIIDKVFNKRLEMAHQIKEIKYTEVNKAGRKIKEFSIDTKDIVTWKEQIELLFERIETSDRYQAVNKLGKEIIKHILETKDLLDEFKGFEEDIIKKRNILAHVKEDFIDGKIILKSSFKGYEEFNFSHDDFKVMRSDLIKYTDNIEKITKLCRNL